MGRCPRQKSEWGGQRLLQPCGLLLPLLPPWLVDDLPCWHVAPPSSASLPSTPHLHSTSKTNPPCFCPKQGVWETCLLGWEGEGNGGTEDPNNPGKAAPPWPADRTAHVQLRLAPHWNQNKSHRRLIHMCMATTTSYLPMLFLPSVHLATSLGPSWFHATWKTNWWQWTESQSHLAWANAPPSSSCLVCS